MKIVGGAVPGNPYYACYAYNRSDQLWGVSVLDTVTLRPVNNVNLPQGSGAWPSIGTVKTPTKFMLGRWRSRRSRAAFRLLPP